MVKPITVVELGPFLRQAAKIWREEEQSAFVEHIAFNPEDGVVIPDTGGIRKIRWSRTGSGKRGGVRVVYFYYNPEMPLYLISMYAKAEREDISPDEKRNMVDFVTALKRKHRVKGVQS